jgi:hypothetical protein
VGNAAARLLTSSDRLNCHGVTATQGGELIVRHGGAEEKIACPKGKKKANWVAFYIGVCRPRLD